MEHVLWFSLMTGAFWLPMEEYFAENVTKIWPSTLSYNDFNKCLACASTDLIVADTVSPADSKDSAKTVILKGGKAFLLFCS